MSNPYWAARMAKAQDIITRKNTKKIDTQLRKYYKTLAKRTINDFEDTYYKILTAIEHGKEPTPADLYKLDKYWQLQGQMRNELQKLGERQVKLLTKNFELNFFEVYHSLALQGEDAYTTLDPTMVHQMINQIWCADGKTWSSRVWQNTSQLADMLNEQLVLCVVQGKKPTELKQMLQDQFNVSYHNADMLVRTELAHIQTQAAQQRYKDYGLELVEVWVDEDERTCPICAKYEGKKYPVNAQMPVPFHPRCRCCMIPVIE